MKLYLIFIIALAGVVSIFGSSITNQTDEKYYHVEPFFKTNWYKANAYCRAIGMHLLSISSKEESDKVKQVIRDLGTVDETFWTSGTKLGDTVYYWLTTGKKLLFTDWAENQPNTYYGGRRCIELWHSADLKWSNDDCDDIYRVICERPTNLTPQ
ncbi:C-type lectin 37Db-like [Sitodiplosis mosellana]|uniref:C-type lectin 37Db-like n=1 Tax=Sitodiplosis mosellana TaxID=263140 RepID=UPI00244487B9|nr:C-type lectin 37Db-like [Sitodiplosis mosellana]